MIEKSVWLLSQSLHVCTHKHNCAYIHVPHVSDPHSSIYTYLKKNETMQKATNISEFVALCQALYSLDFKFNSFLSVQMALMEVKLKLKYFCGHPCSKTKVLKKMHE